MMVGVPGLQAEAEARPVRAPRHDLRAEDGRRRLDLADPEPAHKVGARPAEGNARPAGGPQGDDGPERKLHQGAQAGESGFVFYFSLVLQLFFHLFYLRHVTSRSSDCRQKHQVELMELANDYDGRIRGG